MLFGITSQIAPSLSCIHVRIIILTVFISSFYGELIFISSGKLIRNCSRLLMMAEPRRYAVRWPRHDANNCTDEQPRLMTQLSLYNQSMEPLEVD